MTKKKPPLTAMVAEGLSLVLCAMGALKMREIEGALADTGISCASTRWLTTENILHLATAHLRRDDSPLVILAQVPLMTHGYHLPFDRLVWIGEKPATTHPQYATYQQARGRGWHHTEVIHHMGAIA